MLIFSFQGGSGGWTTGPFIFILFGVLQTGIMSLAATILLSLFDLVMEALGLPQDLSTSELWVYFVECFLYVVLGSFCYRVFSRAYRQGGWPAVAQMLFRGPGGPVGGQQAPVAGGQGQGPQGYTPGGAKRTGQRATVEQVAEALRKLPMETHASQEELAAMSIHALKERLTAAGGDCANLLEKGELLARLDEIGGSACHTCSVCCEDYEAGEPVRVLPCGHRYHIECIDRWLLSSTNYSHLPACPLCKAELPLPPPSPPPTATTSHAATTSAAPTSPS